ncbi:hypothetical protein HU200_002022 [Digitaria exilis]|uniref:ENT domain-containing protein n=1 Tax=Digitaria exilis TaxID=1010633 RepID=A0A835KZM6_9POAL|nr:hypothetical protein HU200_002022 [Digitaria exilis]
MMKLKTRRPAFYKDDHPHLAAQGKPTAKNMKKEGVSPHRSVQLRRSRWVLGDVTEVLDHNSWKLGKITEVLKNDYFVIRLAAYEEDGHNTKRKLANVCASASARTVKRKIEANMIPPNDFIRRTGKKQKVAAYEVRQLTKNVLPLKVSARNASMTIAFIGLQVAEENECSVASCSVNYLEYCTDDDEQSVRILSCFPDDVMSVCPSMSAQENNEFYGSGLHMNVHELELQAYQSTVRAFHAAGPLTWEQESLLTNLRLSLNISIEEHLLQLRHLLSL